MYFWVISLFSGRWPVGLSGVLDGTAEVVGLGSLIGIMDWVGMGSLISTIDEVGLGAIGTAAFG